MLVWGFASSADGEVKVRMYGDILEWMGCR